MELKVKSNFQTLDATALKDILEKRLRWRKLGREELLPIAASAKGQKPSTKSPTLSATDKRS